MTDIDHMLCDRLKKSYQIRSYVNVNQDRTACFSVDIINKNIMGLFIILHHSETLAANYTPEIEYDTLINNNLILDRNVRWEKINLVYPYHCLAKIPDLYTGYMSLEYFNNCNIQITLKHINKFVKSIEIVVLSRDIPTVQRHKAYSDLDFIDVDIDNLSDVEYRRNSI